jgi:hypothetical protein
MMRFPAAVLLSLSLVAQTPIRLADVRKIYVEKMHENFDQYLRSSILKKFHNRLTIALDRSIADAVWVVKTRSGTLLLLRGCAGHLGSSIRRRFGAR